MSYHLDHDETVFLAELSRVNALVGRYVLRSLDADAGRTERPSVEDEAVLGVALVELGRQLQVRADGRGAEAEPVAASEAAGDDSGEPADTSGPLDTPPRSSEP